MDMFVNCITTYTNPITNIAAATFKETALNYLTKYPFIIFFDNFFQLILN